MSTTYQDLVGKTALVTGATSGIGKATAAALARRGARVLVSVRDVVRGEAVVSAIRASSGEADLFEGGVGRSRIYAGKPGATRFDIAGPRRYPRE